MVSTLNNQQLEAITKIKQGKNVFITGSPGTGKSYTLKYCIREIKLSGKNYAVTSSTGCSAVLINGQTLHSYIGIGTGKLTESEYIKALSHKRYKIKQLCELNVLIIDEISMVDNITFDKISNILKAIRKSNKPFGGIQVVLVGDFCQLSPVNSTYCFMSDTWNQLKIDTVYLKELIRQKEDTMFQKILEEIRFGKCSKKTFGILKELENTQLTGLVPTKLFSLSNDVNMVNVREMVKLYKKNTGKDISEAKVVQCFPDISLQNEGIQLQMMNTPEYDEEKDVFRYKAFSNDTMAKLDDYNIDLIKGLQVLITRNINFESGLVNGTMGVIVSLNTSCVTIADMNNKKHVIYYYKDVNENTGKYTKFIPIKIAYAISIHKSQGATLDCIEVDGSNNIFASGQLYTALSRCKCLKNIRLINLDKDSFICSEHVKKFYENVLKEKAEKTEPKEKTEKTEPKEKAGVLN